MQSTSKNSEQFEVDSSLLRILQLTPILRPVCRPGCYYSLHHTDTILRIEINSRSKI